MSATAKAFADKNGIPQPTYAMHETAKRGLRARTARRYAKLLGVRVAWLLTGEEPMRDGSETDRAIDEQPLSTVSTVDARDHFSDLVNRAAFGKERLVLTRRGKSVAAVVPMEDLRILERFEDRIDYDEARRALEEAKKDGFVAWEDLKADLGL